MKPETQEVIKLVEQIRVCENEIYELQEEKKRAEYRLDQLVLSRNVEPVTPIASTEPIRRGRAASETSAKKLIANLLNENPRRDFSATEVSLRLGINIGTVRTNLSKLVGPQFNWIEKRSPNTYGGITPKEKEVSEETS